MTAADTVTRAHSLAAAAARARLDGADSDAISAAEQAAEDAAANAWRALSLDRDRAEGERLAALEDARVAERENETIARLVRVLRDRGPMNGTEISALRIPGASRNVVVSLLRRGADQGRIKRIQNGRRVLWAAVHSHG